LRENGPPYSSSSNQLLPAGDKSKEGSGSDVEGAAEAKKRRKPKRQRDLVLDEEVGW
jgi:hypothetical protein